jgi:hypothetical protein
MSGRERVAVSQKQVTDWSGQLLNKRVLSMLREGCVVRIAIRNLKNQSMEAIYVSITKVKDGSLWGTVMPTYRIEDYVEVPNGSEFAFRKTDVIEVPLSWQPKKLRKKMEACLDPKERGRAITGIAL